MYDPDKSAFVPVPQDRPLSKDERRMQKFTTGEIVYVKGIAMRIRAIEADRLILVPPSQR